MAKFYKRDGGEPPGGGAPPEQKEPEKGRPAGGAPRVLLNLLLVLCLVVLVVSVVQLARTGLAYKRGSDEYHRLAEEYTTSISDSAAALALDFEALRRINPDFVGWLELPGTAISYPVTYRAGDNDTYLSKTFEGQVLGAGAIFADGRVKGDFSEPNTILYGHNMKDGTMFAQLKNYLDSSFLPQNSALRIYTPQGVYHYRIFAARETDVNDAAYRLWFSEGEFSAWAEGLGAPGSSQILTLSTCTNVEDDGRYILLAALEGVTEAGEGPPI